MKKADTPAPSRPPFSASTSVSAGEGAEHRASRWQDFLLHAAVILFAALWAYSPSYYGDWLWDDDQSITANAVAQAPFSFKNIWVNPPGADYFPLTATAFWLEWHAFGPNTYGYHAVNIVLHALAALLLWWLLEEMELPGAWLAGLVFAIHPVCVESVAWVSELKNTLSQPLFLLSAIFFVRSEDPEKAGTPNAVNYILSLVFFLLSMFAKTAVVMFPVVILLYVWWKRGTITPRDILRAAPFFLISLVLGIVTISFQHARAIGQETIPVGGVASRIATAGMGILFYLWKVTLPVGLLTIYPRWEVDPPKLWQFLPWPILAAAAAWCWVNRGTWGRHIIFAMGFFILMLLPILGFITISYMRITWVADHFVYLPMISIIALGCAAAGGWYERANPRVKPLAVVLATAIIACLAIGTFRYSHAWANEENLWTHTLASNHEAWQAHNRLGAKKYAKGDVDAAFYHFTNSTRLRPDLGETHNNLGTVLAARGKIEEAIKEYYLATEATPHVPMLRINLANALASQGRFPEAVTQFLKILEQEPGNAPVMNNCGVVYFKAGDKENAIAMFRKALAINPDLKDSKDSLAVALGEAPDPGAAAPPQAPGQAPLQPAAQQPLAPFKPSPFP